MGAERGVTGTPPGCPCLRPDPSSPPFRSAMALPGPRPAAIPEGEEVPPAACNGEHRAPCGQDERAVSRLQRRHSDVRVYKEFCDFYIKS